jgi:Spy/CpxP family protein refolding chaperone
MNFFLKTRFLFWTLIILVLINVSALASFFIFSNQKPTAAACCPPEQTSQRALSSELGLTQSQTEKVAQINRNYRQQAEPIAASIKEKRETILSELEQPEPDTIFLNQIVRSLSILQIGIQQKNIQQYLELKKVCTPEQTHRLSELYRDLYGCPMRDNDNTMERRHRNRCGQGMHDSSGQD